MGSDGSVVKNLHTNTGVTGDASWILSGRSLEGGNDNPLCILVWKIPWTRGARWATVHRVAKNQTWLNDWAWAQDTYEHRTLEMWLVQIKIWKKKSKILHARHVVRIVHSITILYFLYNNKSLAEHWMLCSSMFLSFFCSSVFPWSLFSCQWDISESDMCNSFKRKLKCFFLFLFLLTVTGIWTSGSSRVGILGYIFRMVEQNDRMILCSEKKNKQNMEVPRQP